VFKFTSFKDYKTEILKGENRRGRFITKRKNSGEKKMRQIDGFG